MIVPSPRTARTLTGGYPGHSRRCHDLRVSLAASTYDSPCGRLTLVATDTHLRAVLWPLAGEPQRCGIREEIIEGSNPVIARTVEQLTAYFDDATTSFDLPLETGGTEFQRSVWTELTGIASGATRTYGEHATAVGRPTSTRAVAAAIGRNPLSIVVPCHRVVGADGSLTGFAGGLDAKRWLLDHEAGRSANLTAPSR